jgi:uncharacterized glyoxalase superfamily protein PhnB
MHPTNRSIPNSTFIPEFGYHDVQRAVTWLRDHFGFEERLRIGDHRAQMCFGDGAIVVMQRSTRPLGTPESATQSTLVRVRDIDTRYSKAIAAKLRIVRAIADYPYGERQFTVQDLGDHVWTFTQTVFDSDPASWGGVLLSRESK